MRRSAILSFIAVALCLLVPAAPASAQDFKRVHRDARLVERHAHDLHEELDDHFRPSPMFERLHKHAREIERRAKEIYAISEAGDGRKRIRREVERLDEEVQQFVRLAEEAKHYKTIPVQAYLHLRREAWYLRDTLRDMRHELDY